MNRSTPPGSGHGTGTEGGGESPTSAGSGAIPMVRKALESGLLAGVAAVVSMLRARRTFRSGDGDKATRQSLLAVFWLGVAMTQWGLNRSERQASRAEPIHRTPGEGTPIDVTERNS